MLQGFRGLPGPKGLDGFPGERGPKGNVESNEFLKAFNMKQF